MSHNVAVVSMEQVTMLLGEEGFQEKDVMGGRDMAGDLLYHISLVTCASVRNFQLTLVRTLLVLSA
jgi:hypothetical protein